MLRRYKRYPPRWSHLLVPTASRAATRAALTMYAPCRRRARAVHRLMWYSAGVLGSRGIPGAAELWTPPMGETAWADLRSRWAEITGPFDAEGIYQQPQRARGGLAVLLLRGGEPVGFVKLRRDGTPLEREFAVLGALTRTETTSFWTPEPLALLAHGGWTSLVTTTLPGRPHRPPARPDLDRITEEVGRTLAGVLPKRPDTPAHWTPMHGDFTPWNLRQTRRREPVLYDWEDTGWGPPGADVTLYGATSSALGGRKAPVAPPEAVTFWQRRLGARPEGDADAILRRKLNEALEAMQQH